MPREKQRHDALRSDEIRNSEKAKLFHQNRTTNIVGKVQLNSKHGTTAPTRGRELGGKHRSAPTGFRHVSKLCDDLLQQFADEYAEPNKTLSALGKHIAELCECSKCQAMKHADDGMMVTEGGKTDWQCDTCCMPYDAYGGRNGVDDDLLQNRLF